MKREYIVWEHKTLRAPAQPARFQQMLHSLTSKNCFVQQLDIHGLSMNKKAFLSHTTGKNIGDYGAERIWRALQSNTSLKSLMMSSVLVFVHASFTMKGNIIGDLGFEELSLALQSNTSLTSLDISCVLFSSNTFHTTVNNMGEYGAERISRALQFNTSLKVLDMYCVLFCSNTSHTAVNKIGESGAESISRALQSNTSLTSLDISSVLFICSIILHNR